MQLFSNLRANLCSVAVDSLTAAENDILRANADLVNGSCQDLGSCKGIGTAELTGRYQHAAVSTAGDQLTKHAFCRRRAHGNNNNFAAGLIFQLQGSLNGVQVVGVGDGCHRSTVHGAVSLDSNLALCIGNLFDTNNSFHCTSCLLTSAARRR